MCARCGTRAPRPWPGRPRKPAAPAALLPARRCAPRCATGPGAAARRRLDALPLAVVVAQIAAMEPGKLLALAHHLRPRLVPGEQLPAPEVAERIVQMDAAELRELVRRLQDRRAAEV